MKRIAVIGAGPSGMAALMSFRSAFDNDPSLASELEIVCFERQESWGGIWNFTLETGEDEYGEPIHSSMYKYLFSNAPKECLEFPDYTFEEHFGRPIATYPPREVLWHYLQGRVEKAGVGDWCRFRTAVREVTYDPADETFDVTSHDLVDDRYETETYDHVIVANGHFSVPNVPEFEGLKMNFRGEVIHSHDFRDAARYKNKDLLIVGSSYSAEDIALQSWKYGAKSITLSYRSSPLGYDWPENIDERPLLERVDRDGIFHFKDGSTKKFDAVCLATGYVHNFDFLPKDLALSTDNRLWPMDLYRGVVFEPNPRLFYLGMQNQFYTFGMFDAQSYYVRDVILGRIRLPPIEDIKADSQKWREREESLKSVTEMIWFQGDYWKGLVQETDCPSFDVDAANLRLETWVNDKKENILDYRDKAYPSLVTGHMSPFPRHKWVDAKRDCHFLHYFPSSKKQIVRPNTEQKGTSTTSSSERKAAAPIEEANVNGLKLSSPVEITSKLNNSIPSGVVAAGVKASHRRRGLRRMFKRGGAA